MDDCCKIPEDKKPPNHDHKHDHGDGCGHPQGKFDYLLWGSLSIVTLGIFIHLSGLSIPYVSDFAHAVTKLMGLMWWGIAFGLIAVGFMNKVPRTYFNAILGKGDTAGGIFRAALAGLLLDLCSHGILMVGAKLYERGASLAQIMTFLIASPWNSITLTLILISLIGLPWTLVFIAASAVIAIITGFMFMALVKRGVLPPNPNTTDMPDDFKIMDDAKKRLKGFRPSIPFFTSIITEGASEAKMVLRWLFFGTILAALIQAFVPTDMIQTWFGPTMLGLLLTLLATTVIEVCSEGSTPIGADLVTRAGAPGNGFAFLMAGVSTDYTEMLVIREFTKSWKTALFLPLLTVPQVLVIGYIMNMTAH